MKLKEAQLEDSHMLFEWANDTEVRQMAFSTEPIKWELHNKWFKKRLKNQNCKIYIFTNEDVPVGQIRFDITNDGEVEVDVHTNPAFRGKGIGTQIISLGVYHFLNQTGLSAIHAIIKLENVKSRKAFEKAGFREVEKKLVNGYECFHMIKDRV